MERRRSAPRCSGDSMSDSGAGACARRRSHPCYGMAEASLGVTFKPAGNSFRTLGVDAEKLALDRRRGAGKQRAGERGPSAGGCGG